MDDTDFTLIHLNSRSLQKNFTKVISSLYASSVNFNLIGVSETWTNSKNDNSTLYNIDGYNSIFQNREFSPGHEGGGVALYIKNNLQYKIRQDLMSTNPAIYESLFCEVGTVSKKSIVGVIYRPPGTDVDTFNAELIITLRKLSKSKLSCYLMGDFNINLINVDSDRKTNEFLSMMVSMSFTPLIDKPTRITDTSATCIDNIFVDIANLQRTKSGIYTTDISDHLPVFCVTSNKCKPTSKYKFVESRNMCNDSINRFNYALSNQNWDFIYQEPDPNRGYVLFLDTYSDLYNTFFPIVRRKIRCKTFSKPWLTFGLLKSIKNKNKLYNKYLRLRNPNDKVIFRAYSNKLCHILKIAERRYYTNELQSAQSSMRDTWKILKSIISNDNKSQFPSFFTVGPRVVSDIKDIANGFNNYFINVGQTLASKIPATNTTYSEYLGTNINSNFFLNPIVEKELTDVVTSLNSNKSAGPDHISPLIVKSSIISIAKPLTDIFNKSYTTGIVPDSLKIARVVPIFKDGDPKLYSNYRPISILTCFSKILERLTYNRLYSYFKFFFNNAQFGFRKHHSTYMALLSLFDNLTRNLDNGEITAGIFLDLSKAFDTVDHSILINKLNHYGVRGNSCDWFASYLTNRQQFVHINGTNSNFSLIHCGVPQGSILGPLLFLIYINDITNTSDICNFILFADDTNVFLSDKDPHILNQKINAEFEKIQNWFKCNKLSLNIKKTHYLLFNTRHHDPSLIHIQNLTRQNKTKFLGVYIDDNLNWNDHITHVMDKISRAVGILNKARKLLPTKALKTLYCSLVLPYLQYCNIVWGSNYYARLHRLFLLQKKAIRIINNAEYLAHTAPLFIKSNQLNVFDINKLQMGNFMYNFLHRLLPDSILNSFDFTQGTHPHNTRHKTQLIVPRFKYMTRSFSIAVCGPKLWNATNDYIQKAKSINIFKNLLKKHLLSTYITNT